VVSPKLFLTLAVCVKKADFFCFGTKVKHIYDLMDMNLRGFVFKGFKKGSKKSQNAPNKYFEKIYI